MLSFERRWARSLLSGFAPVGGPGLAPLRDEVDYEGVLVRMMREATPLAALGLRAAVWVGALAPLWLWGKLSTISKLAHERRPDLLRALLGHRVFVVRELALLLKLCAAMALLGTPSVRMRSGYDHVKAAKAESGLRLITLEGAQRKPHLRVWPAGDGTNAAVQIPREAP
jgi:hypothetical protein